MSTTLESTVRTLPVVLIAVALTGYIIERDPWDIPSEQTMKRLRVRLDRLWWRFWFWLVPPP